MESKTSELINADIDGELEAGERAELDTLLAADPEAQKERDALAELCAGLDAMEAVEPPAGLRQSILNSIPEPRATAANADDGGAFRDFVNLLFGGSAIRYAMSFVAGAVLTFSFINTSQISPNVLNDVSGLVGTMSRAGLEGEDSINVDLNEIAGSVTLNTSDAIMILDFDLASSGPIEIVTSFDDRDIWFNGFAQLESRGTTIAAEQGSVTVRMEGQRRYAVYLNSTSQDPATIGLRFYSGGTLIHEDTLEYGSQ